MVNDAISGFGIAEAPHGGFKQSGIGRTHGRLGLGEMVQVKYVDVDLMPRMPKVWWYGYGRELKQQMGGISRHAVLAKLGRQAERRAALRRTTAPLQPHLRQTSCGLEIFSPTGDTAVMPETAPPEAPQFPKHKVKYKKPSNAPATRPTTRGSFAAAT